MSVILPRRAISAVTTSNDPRKTIQDFVGDLEDFRVLGDLVLVGIYMRPEKTKGGIIRPDSNLEEDVFQGKVGLVLKWGTDAFRNPETGELYEDHVKTGEWCVFKIGDGWQFELKGYPCRLVRDVNIRMVIQDPLTVL